MKYFGIPKDKSKKMCAREDSNFHILNGYWPLKPARLPIPPRAHLEVCKNKKS
jgi:hypothetical protein